jgi:hypothetical protein
VTVTVNPQVAVCPSLDRAVTVTGVVPTGKLLPDAGEPLTVTGATPPDVVAVYVTTTADPFEELTVILAGQVTTSVGTTPDLATMVTVTDTVIEEPVLLWTRKEL